jgi:hypothetical protein
MSRLKEVSDRDAGRGARFAFFLTKRKLAQMTGLETAGMLEPLRLYAHIPRLLNAYGRLEQAEAKLDILSPRHRALAELKSATTVRCEYCIAMVETSQAVTRPKGTASGHFSAQLASLLLRRLGRFGHLPWHGMAQGGGRGDTVASVREHPEAAQRAVSGAVPGPLTGITAPHRRHLRRRRPRRPGSPTCRPRLRRAHGRVPSN